MRIQYSSTLGDVVRESMRVYRSTRGYRQLHWPVGILSAAFVAFATYFSSPIPAGPRILVAILAGGLAITVFH